MCTSTERVEPAADVVNFIARSAFCHLSIVGAEPVYVSVKTAFVPVTVAVAIVPKFAALLFVKVSESVD